MHIISLLQHGITNSQSDTYYLCIQKSRFVEVKNRLKFRTLQFSLVVGYVWIRCSQ